MARVTGPLFSMSASGTVGDAITYGQWKGIQWAREWFIPYNPQSVKQTNVRTALTILVVYWQSLHVSLHDTWNTFAEGTKKSGFNQFVGRGMLEYIEQITVDVTPLSVSILDDPPAETWSWVPVT